MGSIGPHVGARPRRNEDARHLRGAGHFLADLRLPGMRDVAFVRSQQAHGRIQSITSPSSVRPGEVWTAADVEDIAPIVADSGTPGFHTSNYPLLAKDKVRFVGEPVALVLGDDRAAAEDLADQVMVDIDPLPAVVDVDAALQPGCVLLHERWPDNRFVATSAEFGDVDVAAGRAAVSVTREYRMGRQSAVPLETRGCVAYYDNRLDQLVLYSSTQFPHIIRSALARHLRIDERRLRVVAPDVGGGFGLKNNLNPEEVLIAAVAMSTGYPVRWIEDRYEHMVASPHAREHLYRITAHAAADGELLAVEAEILVNVGAYSVWPWTAAMEAGMSAGMIPGPYRLRNYRFMTSRVATNKSPLGPYRGVARPGACFAIERTIDELAHELGMEPKDVRIKNLLRPEEFPYTSVTGKVYDSGDYAESVRGAARLIDHDGVRRRQQNAESTSSARRIGVGYATFTEQTAHGTKEWALRGLPVVFGFEQARASLDPSGSLTLSTGIQSHGQGLETTLAQVASDLLGVDPKDVSVRHGDTDTAPYGMGTFGSRSMVMAGGAVHGACTELADKVKAIAAGLMGCDAADIRLHDGKVEGPQSSMTLAEVAEMAYLRLDLLPEGIKPVLDTTCAYQPTVDTGTYSYATHAATVQVDLDTGEVHILDYVVIEDCGTVVNPMIVEGQIHGGVAQGIGTALYEELLYDDLGQPKATTFMDYLLPGASEVPDIQVGHMDTPSPFTVLGMKGMGEGGAIAPPAAIANAVTDALRDFGVAVNRTPITPERLWLCLQDRPPREMAMIDPISKVTPWPQN